MKTAAGQIKENANNVTFCVYSEVELADSHGKVHTLKPFLVIGSPLAAVTPLLNNLKGARKPLYSGSCSLQEGKISLTSKGSAINYTLFQSQKSFFRELLGGKEILVPKAGGAAAPPDPARPAKLANAAVHWSGARTAVGGSLGALKQAVRKHYAQSPPQLVKAINDNLHRIDKALENLDHRLSDALRAASAATGPATQTQMQKAHAVIQEYKQILTHDPMIARIDENPFGVPVKVRQTLLASLQHAEQSLG
jgi:hypothetical protein